MYSFHFSLLGRYNPVVAENVSVGADSYYAVQVDYLPDAGCKDSFDVR